MFRALPYPVYAQIGLNRVDLRYKTRYNVAKGVHIVTDDTERVIILDPLDKIVIRLQRLSSYIGESRLIRPNAMKYKNLLGTVHQLGPRSIPAEYRGYRPEVGDTVIFRDWRCLTEISRAGKNLFLVKLEDLVGMIER